MQVLRVKSNQDKRTLRPLDCMILRNVCKNLWKPEEQGPTLTSMLNFKVFWSCRHHHQQRQQPWNENKNPVLFQCIYPSPRQTGKVT